MDFKIVFLPWKFSGIVLYRISVFGNIMDKVIPTGVKIISVLYYISAAFLVLGGILVTVGSSFLGSVAEYGNVSSSLGVGVGVFLIALAVLNFFIARGLWKGQSWARIISIVFNVLGVLGAIYGIVQGMYVQPIVSLLINAAIGGYLLFSSEVKAAFANV